MGTANVSFGNTDALSGIAFGGAVPGNQAGLLYGYTDRRDFNLVSNNGELIKRPISPGQLVTGIDGGFSIGQNNSGQTTDNVYCAGFSSNHLVKTKAFVYNRLHYEEWSPTFPSGTTYEGEVSYNTFAGSQNYFYFLGKPQDYFTVGSNTQLNNWFEYIGWKVEKDDEYMRSYINESKEYFTNKKITQ